MEQKFLLFTLFAFFATFGNIETSRRSGHSGNWTRNSLPANSWSAAGSNRPSSPHDRYNGNWPYRPFGTVPPPRHHDNTPAVHNFSSGLRPFGTVPPPRYHGNHSTQNPWIRRQPDPCWIASTPPPYPYPRREQHDHHLRPYPRLFGPGYGQNNGSIQQLNNSSRLYPTLDGLGEIQSNGQATRPYGTVLNNTDSRPFNPEYYGNSGSQIGHHYPRGSEGLYNERTGEAYAIVPNSTATSSSIPGYQGNSSSQNTQFYPSDINPRGDYRNVTVWNNTLQN